MLSPCFVVDVSNVMYFEGFVKLWWSFFDRRPYEFEVNLIIETLIDKVILWWLDPTD